MGPSGRRCLGILWTSPARSGSTASRCPSCPSPSTLLVCSAIAVLLSGLRPLEKNEQDKDDVNDDVHQPTVGVHPVAHLRHQPLGAMPEQKVEEYRKRRYQDGRSDEWHRCEKAGAALREVHPDRYQDHEV